MRELTMLVGLMMLGLSACATPKVAGACPESEQVRCLTAQVCAPDRERGCQVCTCEPAWNADAARGASYPQRPGFQQ